MWVGGVFAVTTAVFMWLFGVRGVPFLAPLLAVPTVYCVDFARYLVTHLARPSHHPEWRLTYEDTADRSLIVIVVMSRLRTPPGPHAFRCTVRPPGSSNELEGDYARPYTHGGCYWAYPPHFPGAPPAPLNPGEYAVEISEAAPKGTKWHTLLRDKYVVPAVD
jgi:hypothetical protein